MLHIGVNSYVPRCGHVTIGLLIFDEFLEAVKLPLSASVRNIGGLRMSELWRCVHLHLHGC